MNARWVAFAAAVAVAFGVWVRVDGLGTKIYGFDETITALRVSGHSMHEYEAYVNDGRTHAAAELRRFQTADPATSSADTIATLAAEDPQHPPVFYVLERWSSAVFGDSFAGRRALAALAAVLGIAAAYWLGLALLGRAGAWCLAALVAVSPFHVVYAQQAREYSAWSLLTLLGSAVLLEAQRRRSARWYAVYAVVGAIGLYTDPLYGAVMIAHAVYVALRARGEGWASARPFVVAAAAAGLAFVPWLAVIASNRHVIAETTTWLAASVPAKTLVAKWAFGAVTAFFDLEYAFPRLIPVALLVLALEAFAVVVLARTRGSARAFILPMMLVTAVILIVPDLLLHESRSTALRYLTPTWIGLQLAVAWLLVQPARSARTGAARAAAFVVLLLAGAASDVVSSRATAWWLDTNDAPLVPIAATVAASHGTIVFSRDPYYALELSNMLPPDTPLRLGHGLSAAGVAGPAFAVASRADFHGAPLGNLERVPVHVVLPAGARYGSGDDAFVIALWRLRR